MCVYTRPSRNALSSIGLICIPLVTRAPCHCLDTPDCELTPAELAMLEPTLKHICESMCSGVVGNNDIALDWMAYVAQSPDKTIEKADISELAQSVGTQAPCLASKPL